MVKRLTASQLAIKREKEDRIKSIIFIDENILKLGSSNKLKIVQKLTEFNLFDNIKFKGDGCQIAYSKMNTSQLDEIAELIRESLNMSYHHSIANII